MNELVLYNDAMLSSLPFSEHYGHTIHVFYNRARKLASSVADLVDTITNSRLSFDQDDVPYVENVRIAPRFGNKTQTTGMLYITTSHLIFVDPVCNRETWILMTHILSAEKLPAISSGSPLLIRCKNFLSMTFIIPKEGDCHNVYQSIMRLSKTKSIEDLYAFHYNLVDTKCKSDGWDFCDIQTEYSRMGVPNKNWMYTPINKDYEICDTYPRHLYVPASVNTPTLIGSSKFRSRGRIPVLSYYHRDNEAAICRCSQPLAGFSSRCMEDEVLLHAIYSANPNRNNLYIVDNRPKINAMVNRATNKGYENEKFYSHVKFFFLGIENIHVMRSSLQKLLDVTEMKAATVTDFLSGVESSGWLKHIRAVLDTSRFVAQAITQGTSVLVHCSDGWDRTSQTCALASIILDPYYRTIQGFKALIEKEWLSFGHKFIDRCGHVDSTDPKDVSPVFTQFIDCTWQLWQQFPTAFQFNERFLVMLHDHVFSCQFGTFIGNCEKDRVDLRLSERTYSLWAFILDNLSDYVNPLYKKEHEISGSILQPNTLPQSIVFWAEMYNRFDIGLHPRENVLDTVCALNEHSLSLEDHSKLLEKRICHLYKLLGHSDEEIQEKLDDLLSSDDSACLPSNSVSDEDNHLQNVSNTPSAISPSVPLIEKRLAETKIKTSDSESGFEDASSVMSRSGPDEACPPQEILYVDQLVGELRSVAVNWCHLRNVTGCSCATNYEYHSKKYHCWSCGNIFCGRCISRSLPLPGHYYQRLAPICKQCLKDMKYSNETLSANYNIQQS